MPSATQGYVISRSRSTKKCFKAVRRKFTGYVGASTWDLARGRALDWALACASG